MLDGAANLAFLALAAMQGATNLPQQTLHSSDREGEVDRKSGAQVLQHLVALSRLVLDEELIDDDRQVIVFAQAGHASLQVLGPVSFVAGGVF